MSGYGLLPAATDYRVRVPQPTAADDDAAFSWPGVAGAMVGLQAVVVLAFAVFYLVEAGGGFSTFNVLASAGMFVLVGAGLALVARGLLAGRRWARSPALTWQIVCLPVAFGLVQSGRWYVGVPLGISGLLALRGLFPASQGR